jgi:DNA-binding MarR family transcriptional regulator
MKLPQEDLVPMRRTRSMPIRKESSAAAAHFAAEPLMDRVGFLIRRLHQIHVALFVQQADGMDITTIQFTALSVLHQSGEIDQSVLAVQVGMDRTNVSEVVRRLASRGYVKVRINPTHGRRRLIALTPAGLAFLKKADDCARIAQDRTIAPLSPGERRIFADLLRRLVQEQNALGRAPLRLK